MNSREVDFMYMCIYTLLEYSEQKWHVGVTVTEFFQRVVGSLGIVGGVMRVWLGIRPMVLISQPHQSEVVSVPLSLLLFRLSKMIQLRFFFSFFSMIPIRLHEYGDSDCLLWYGMMLCVISVLHNFLESLGYITMITVYHHHFHLLVDSVTVLDDWWNKCNQTSPPPLLHQFPVLLKMLLPIMIFSPHDHTISIFATSPLYCTQLSQSTSFDTSSPLYTLFTYRCPL